LDALLRDKLGIGGGFPVPVAKATKTDKAETQPSILELNFEQAVAA
jgi:hypothetical protein